MQNNIYSHIGGLTSRQGITKIQKITLANSIHACGVINKLIQEFAGIHCKTSEQHKVLGQSLSKRDQEDTKVVVNYMKSGSRFKGDPCVLRNFVPL
jgi:hypothetical protein